MTVRLFCLMGLALLSLPDRAAACYAGAIGLDPSMAYGFTPVSVRQEWVVIIWDSKTHTEHFIRSEQFQTNSTHLALFVPTPSAPEIASADPQIFQMMKDVTAPRLVPVLADADLLGSAISALAGPLGTTERKPLFISPSPSPFDQGEANVNFKAAVLDPSKNGETSDWIKRNAVDLSRFNVLQWLDGYGQKKWKINAFTFTQAEGENSLFRTGAVRLSFKTDQPFFPYSEPCDSEGKKPISSGGRELHISVISDTPVSGTLGDGSAWPGELQFTGSSAPDPNVKQFWTSNKWLILAGLPEKEVPRCITSFLDTSNPRPDSGDLYFYPDPERAPFRTEITDVTLTPILYLSWPDLAGLFIALLLPVLFGGMAVLAWENTTLLKRHKTDATSFPARSKAKTYTSAAFAVLGLMVGSFFALTLFVLPFLYVIRTVILVLRPEKILESRQFRANPSLHLIYFRFCSVAMIGLAIAYIYYVIWDVYTPM